MLDRFTLWVIHQLERVGRIVTLSYVFPLTSRILDIPIVIWGHHGRFTQDSKRSMIGGVLTMYLSVMMILIVFGKDLSNCHPAIGLVGVTAILTSIPFLVVLASYYLKRLLNLY